MKDRYKEWFPFELPGGIPIRPIQEYHELESLVIHDLDQATDEVEKREILDSYSIARQRDFRNNVIHIASSVAGGLGSKIIELVLKEYIPAPEPPWHNRAAVKRAQNSI